MGITGHKSVVNMRAFVFIIVFLATHVAVADDNRARVNYMLHCQGCHLPSAEGVVDRVPRMKDFLGYYMHSEDGRRFIVQVPGVSTAQISDDEVAELMNWLLVTYSRNELPDQYLPYTAAEVSRLRDSPEPDPLVTRVRILRAIAEDLPALASEQEQYE